MHLEHTALLVDDYDEAIRFFVEILGFDLIEDSPAVTSVGGRPKRWVVVRPPRAETGILLARADGPEQAAAVGNQAAGRVGWFLRVDDFEAAHQRLLEAGVEFEGEARHEPYGSVAVFADVAGNRWDLLGPPPADGARAEAVIVRRERPADADASRAIHAAAFTQGDDEPAEARLLDQLRLDGWIPELSWVAELDGQIIGHNICTRGYVDLGDGATAASVPCVGLGPIGVAPDRQISGVGSKLMWAMIGAADARGEPLIALLGDPGYYRRFGFRTSTDVAIEAPDPGWGPYFQVLPLSGWTPSIRGTFRYAAPFAADDLG